MAMTSSSKSGGRRNRPKNGVTESGRYIIIISRNGQEKYFFSSILASNQILKEYITAITNKGGSSWQMAEKIETKAIHITAIETSKYNVNINKHFHVARIIIRNKRVRQYRQQMGQLKRKSIGLARIMYKIKQSISSWQPTSIMRKISRNQCINELERGTP